MQMYKKTSINSDEIKYIAEKMKKEGRRLVMIHGYVDKQGQNVISYQYEVGNCIEAYEVVGSKILPTISDVYDLAAAWPEREIEELMEVKFEGLKIKDRLFMPENMIEGKGQILVTPLSKLRESIKAKED